jgi:retinol dehydrogenase-12
MGLVGYARGVSHKTIVLTGGNRGLGRATAEVLAKAGHAVILTSRDPDKGAHAVREIREAHPGANVEHMRLDLASLADVRRFAGALRSRDRLVDVLFHNAGVLQQSHERHTSADGYEETLAVNTLAPFLLTHELLPLLLGSHGARVVWVSSRLHLPDSRGEPVRFDFDDPQLERGYQHDVAYKNSKLAMLWLAYELARRVAPVALTSNAVCPGFVPVTAAESTHGVMKWVMRHVLPHMSFTVTPEDAASALAFMAVDPSLGQVTGKFYGEKHELESSPESHDHDKAGRFWRLACELVGVSDWP